MPDLFDDTHPPDLIKLPRACRCGNRWFRLEAGVAMHAAGLRCHNCGLHGGWLSRSELAAHREHEASHD